VVTRLRHPAAPRQNVTSRLRPWLVTLHPRSLRSLSGNATLVMAMSLTSSMTCRLPLPKRSSSRRRPETRLAPNHSDSSQATRVSPCPTETPRRSLKRHEARQRRITHPDSLEIRLQVGMHVSSVWRVRGREAKAQSPCLRGLSVGKHKSLLEAHIQVLSRTERREQARSRSS
jgi:hypothetical protein